MPHADQPFDGDKTPSNRGFSLIALLKTRRWPKSLGGSLVTAHICQLQRLTHADPMKPAA